MTKQIKATKGLVAAGLTIAIAMGCATTEMTSTWTDPSAKGAAMSKIAVVCLTKDAGLRRVAEDAAAAQMAGAQATPSYQVLGDADLKDKDAVKAKLKASGFNGVLVMRLASVNEQVTPVSTYGDFDGYYGWAGGAVYAPGYMETDHRRQGGQQPVFARRQQAGLVGHEQDLRPGVGEGVHDRRVEGGCEVTAEGPRASSDCAVRRTAERTKPPEKRPALLLGRVLVRTRAFVSSAP